VSGLRGAIITQVLDEADPVLGFAVGWVNALAARLVQVETICLSRGDASLAPNVHVTVLPAGRLARYRRVRSVLGRLAHDGGLDFVLAHMCPSYAVAATVPTRRAPTFLWYAHSSVTRMLRMAERRCDRVFSCSTASYPRRSPRLVVVGHGIDTERFAPADEGEGANGLTICSVGRITKSKRLDLLVEALARCRVRCPQVRFGCRIVGPADEQYLGGLRSLIERSGLGDSVRIEPPLAHGDVARVYQTSDVVANMTARHSLDKATLEAMACGCLVLTTNGAFAPVLGEHAKLMVQADASADALAGAIERLASLDAATRRRVGGELRDIVVREHSLPRMMDRIVGEIHAVCSARGLR
jgi:glycosyltransferase involved in cell wall biosynthesis